MIDESDKPDFKANHLSAVTDFADLAGLRLAIFLSGNERLVFRVDEAPAVSIIIPTFNRASLTYIALESLLACEPAVPYEVILVDNCSQDETRELLKRLVNVQLVLNDQNLGFGHAGNQGVERARGRYICFLNSDVQVTPGWLDSLREMIESYPACAAVGSKLVHPNGRLQEAGSIIWSDGSAFGYGRGDDPLLPEFGFVREVDYCSAACLLVKKEVFVHVGGFDLRYAPAYYEDADLCMAIRDAGYTVTYQPKSTVFHIEYGSSNTQKAISLHIANQTKFAKKWSGPLTHQSFPSPNYPIVGRDRRTGRHVLVVDDRIPISYYGSGFPRTRALLDTLIDNGYVVTYLPRDPRPDTILTPAMQQRGIEVLYGVTDIIGKLRERPNWYDVAIVSRPHNAELLTPIGQINSRAVLIYDAEAIYSLRDIRQAEAEGRVSPAEEADAAIRGELKLLDSADLVVTVSEIERRFILDHRPDTEVMVWDMPIEPTPPTTNFTQRNGFLFVGYLETPPNAHAVRLLLTELVPRITEHLDCTFLVVGADPPEDIRCLAAKFGNLVRLTGYVDDLQPIYDHFRVFLAPHRFAAGKPLKVIEAMSRGVPCVISQLLADQLGVTDGIEALIATDAEEFAQKAAQLYSDAILWQKIQSGATSYVRSNYDPDILKLRLRDQIEAAIERKGKRLAALETRSNDSTRLARAEIE